MYFIMSCLTHPILDGLVCGVLLHAATRVHLNETYVTDGTCVRARVTSAQCTALSFGKH